MTRFNGDFGFSILIEMGPNTTPTTEKRGAVGALWNAASAEPHSPSGKRPCRATCRYTRRGLEEVT